MWPCAAFVLVAPKAAGRTGKNCLVSRSLQALKDRITGQLCEYENLASDRLKQCQHQATKIKDLETKLAIALADLDAAGKQAQALQMQAVQAMDVRHTMQQMKDVMSQQHSAQQSMMEVR